ncbi:Uncharacterised protein [Mycobacterium tuberculosis]|nr:Uncharacterised protein [Mycobacterium tuberculosis]
MSGPLALFLRQVRGGQDLAGELVGRAHVDEVLDVDGRQDLVGECPNRVIRRGGGVGGHRPADRVAGQRASVELPLLAAAVEQLDLLMAVELEIPVRVGGEPIVVAAVQDHRVLVGDATLGQQLGELLGVDEVTFDRILQVGAPVQLDRAGNMVTVICTGVLVHFDENDLRRVQIALSPVGGDQDIAACHGGNPFA